MGGLVFDTKPCHLFVGKVRPVIGDDVMKEPKATCDVLSEEFDYLLFRDIGEAPLPPTW